MEPSIVTLTKTRIPTIVCYGEDAKDYVIGESARRVALNGQTNIWGFKRDLGEPDSVFNKKKYWFYFPEEDTGKHRIETLSAKDATVEFLRQLLKEYDLPDQLTIGEPGVREDKWKENFRRHIREVFDILDLPNPRFSPNRLPCFSTTESTKRSFLPEKNLRLF